MPDLCELIESLGPAGFYRRVCGLLDEKTLVPEDFSLRRLAEACGVLPELGRLNALAERTGDGPPDLLLREDRLEENAAGATTQLFRVVTGELVGRKVIDGYGRTDGLIADRLVTVLPSRTRGQRLAGFTALAGPTEVPENAEYEESTFGEKFVTAEEAKRGRILSITEELIGFDQTGEVLRRASALGESLRQDRERAVVRAVVDRADRPVYRPGGVGTPLFPADGSHRNRIGPGNTTSPDHADAVPLTDAAGVEAALAYRATQVLDDRVDGQRRPVVAPARQLLVPEALSATARSIVGATEVSRERTAGGKTVRTTGGNPVSNLEVLSSPFLDETGGSAGTTWYLGDFPRQFVWTEIWPVQTFLQRSDGPAAFDRDVALRVKARYFGGVTCTDTAFVTRVAGV